MKRCCNLAPGTHNPYTNSKEVAMARFFLAITVTLATIVSVASAQPVPQYQWTIHASGFKTPNRVTFTLAAVDSNIVWGSSANATDAFDSSSAEFTTTTNGGATWVAGTVTDAADLRSSCIAAIDANTAWNSMTDIYQGTRTNGGIFKTVDGGSTWSKQTTAYPGPTAYANFVHFFDMNNGVTMGNPAEYETYFEGYTTTNGGTNWTRIPRGSIPDAQYKEQGFDRCYAVVGNTVWFGTKSGRVYKSIDRGATWTVSIADHSSKPFIHSLTFSDTSNGIATFYLGNYISRTTDGGETWNSSTAPTNPSTAYITNVPGMTGVYVITAPSGYGFNPGSAMTTDNGASWTVLDYLIHQRATFVTSTVGWSGGINTDSSTGGIFKWSQVTSTLIHETVGRPNRFELSQNYPNPFNPSTTIRYGLANRSSVRLVITNTLGQQIAVLVNREQEGGYHQVEWQANVASGIYFYRIDAASTNDPNNRFVQVNKMSLLR
jgi:photosystem II stability/assembly factor-like uncharacterized protein